MESLKKCFRKIFFQDFLNNSVFGKIVRKYRDTKLLTTKERKNYLVSEQTLYNTQLCHENLLPIETKKHKYS